VFAFCDIQGIEIVMINRGAEPTFEEERATDVLEIITVFSARLYGAGSKTHNPIKQALTDASGTYNSAIPNIIGTDRLHQSRLWRAPSRFQPVSCALQAGRRDGVKQRRDRILHVAHSFRFSLVF